MKGRIEKSDVEFLCAVTKALAFVAQRINRQLSKGAKPKAGTTALAEFRKIDFARLRQLEGNDGLPMVGQMVACYNEVLTSEQNGWRSYVFEWAWKPELYNIADPFKSMSVEQWGVVKGKTDFGSSWPWGSAAPLSYRLSQCGQIRTLLDAAKSLNEGYHFKDCQSFLSTFDDAIAPNVGRGSISLEAKDIVRKLLMGNADKVFHDDGLDMDMFADIVESNIGKGRPSPIDRLFLQREKIFILRIATLLNDIMHYTGPDGLVADLDLVFKRDEPFPKSMADWVIHGFKGFVIHRWDKLVNAEGRLCNETLEKVLVGHHEKRLDKLGLGGVLTKDYVPDGPCGDDTIMAPKKSWGAPIYVKDRFFRDHCSGEPVYVKACGPHCGDIGSPELYEFQLIMPVLDREVKRGNYVRKENYYLPACDDTLAIFYEGHGRVAFDMMHDQRLFMYEWRTSGRLPQREW